MTQDASTWRLMRQDGLLPHGDGEDARFRRSDEPAGA